MRISDWSSDVCSSDLITRTGGLPPRGKKVRDQRNRHRGHENDLLPGPRHRDIEPALTAILSEHAEEATKCALRVAAEGRGEDDDIALVALHILDVLDEEAHILAAFDAIPLARERNAERCIILGAVLEHFLDQVRLFDRKSGV